MNRQKFLLSTLAATPLIAFAQLKQKVLKKFFKVDAGKSRFNETMLYKGKNPNDIKISGKDTNGEIALFEYTGYEKIGPSWHVHFNQDEVFYVVEGEYRFKVGEDIMTLHAGETVFLPRKVPHTWLQLSDKGKLIYFVQPAGKMEDFFRTINNLKKPPTLNEIEKIHVTYDMQLLGPGLQL
jgi:quercetin 2,3-dioxygenase